MLSATMLQQSSLDDVVDLLKPEDMYAERHRRIFEAEVELHREGKPVDIVTVGAWLKNRDRLPQVGGSAYLVEICNAAPFVADVRAYAEIVAKKSRVRQLIASCQRIAAEGYVDYGEADEFIDRAAQELSKLAMTSATSAVGPLGAALQIALRELSEAGRSGNAVVGSPTGIATLDRVTGGFHAGELTIVAARPGSGKTAFGMQVANHTAARGDAAVFFSLEMTRKQLAIRWACSHGEGIDSMRIRTGTLRPLDWNKLVLASTELIPLPFDVDDKPAISLLELRGKVRRWKSDVMRVRKRKPRLVVIDYLQLMRASVRKGAPSREQEVAEISKGLKVLAAEEDLAVWALCQLNRDVEKRGDRAKKPKLSDLRESGSIEQDADNVFFLWSDEEPNQNGIKPVTCTIGKQRNGLGEHDIALLFEKTYTRFKCVEDGSGYHDRD